MGGSNGAALELPSALRTTLPAYAAFRTRQTGVLIHVVGGAHVLPASADNAASVVRFVATEQRQLSAVLLELCPERSWMLNDLLESPGGFAGPPTPVDTLSTMLWKSPQQLIDPLFWVGLPGAAIEAIVRGRMGGEQAAAARVAHEMAAPVVLCDQYMSLTKIRCMAMALVGLTPFAKRYRDALRGPWSPAPDMVAPPVTPSPAAAASMESLKSKCEELWVLMTNTLGNSSSASEAQLISAGSNAERLLTGIIEAAECPSSVMGGSRIGSFIRQPLLEERDAYLAHQFYRMSRLVPENSAMVAIVGAAHVPGVQQQLKRIEQLDDAQIEREAHALSCPWSYRNAILNGTARNLCTSPVFDEVPIVTGGVFGLLVGSFVPMGLSFVAYRHCMKKAKQGDENPLRWFKRFRMVGVTAGLMCLGIEIYCLASFVRNLRTLQLRWHESFNAEGGGKAHR